MADLTAPQPRTLKATPWTEVRAQVMGWLDEQPLDDSVQAAAEELWAVDEARQTADAALEALARTVALADDRARSLVELCSRPRPQGPLPAQDWLRADDRPAWMRNNLRLFYGRWLSHAGLYDELLEELADLVPADVIDPAALLFYQSVAHHWLLNKEAGLATVGRLLDEVVDSPRRYTSVAGLMRRDLEGLEEESLDHIARRMGDIRRRLELGRAGKKVRQVEDDVVASLDKLIEEMEQQQQQQSGGSSGAMRPTAPMQDSRPAGARGAGEVTRRNIGDTPGWGDMPPKQREEALQQIGKDFPSHYRDAIEQYFRKLAAEDRGP